MIRFPGNVFAYWKKWGLSLPGILLLLSLAGITLSEVAILYGYLGYALWGYLLTLLLCVLGPLGFEDDERMLQAIALVPVFRLVNLSMPVFFESTLYHLPFIYGPLIPAVFLVARSLPGVQITAGWKRAFIGLPLAIPISAYLGIIEYSLIDPAPLAHRWNVQTLLLVAVVVFGFVAVAEELLFRGLIQRTFEKNLGRWSGLIITSVLFGLMHTSSQFPLGLLFATFVGFFLGIVYDYVESIVLVIIMHGTLNLFLFAVLPFHPWLLSYSVSFFPG